MISFNTLIFTHKRKNTWVEADFFKRREVNIVINALRTALLIKPNLFPMSRLAFANGKLDGGGGGLSHIAAPNCCA